MLVLVAGHRAPPFEMNNISLH